MKGQIVFANWADDGYYYPAKANETDGDLVNINFMDGTEDQMTKEYIMNLQEAYQAMTFESDWEMKGEYYKCIITDTQPLTVKYEDDVIEQIDLIQLRGRLPKKKKRSSTHKKQTENAQMEYDDIMQKITSGLTGESENDKKYLLEQTKKYKSHKLSNEIVRGIGRLIYKIIPSETRSKVELLINNDVLSFDAAIEEAGFQIHNKSFNRALEILESIISKYEDENDELKMFIDDNVSEYHYFQNLFEEILYKAVFNPERTVRRMSKNFDLLYFMYGNLLFELKRFDEAKIVLEKVNRINPINAHAILELAEIYKLEGAFDRFLEKTKHCHSIAYTGNILGRCYRNIGYYYIEKQNYDVAIALFYVSLFYDKQDTIAQSQLSYIQLSTKKSISQPSPDEIKKIFNLYNIPFGADKLVLSLAAQLGKKAQEQEQYETARFFFSILYNLTFDDDVIGWIDSLPASDELNRNSSPTLDEDF